MAIMRIISRLILHKSPAPRWLCTVTEEPTAAATVETATQPRKRNLLFYKVVKASSKSSVSDILNNWVNQGNAVKRYDLVDLSSYFRSHKNFRAALQKKQIKRHGALLGCYCRERDFSKAFEIFEEMKILNYSTTLNYNNMLSLYYGTEQPEKVIALVQEMEEKNIAPDLYTYNLLINSYAALKNLDAIEGVLEKMKSNNVECDLFTCGNLATVYLNSGLHDKANVFLGMMEKMEIQPDKNAFEACRTLIKLYSEMNDLSGVNRAWERLKSAFPSRIILVTFSCFWLFPNWGIKKTLRSFFKEWEKGCSSYDYRLPNVLLEYYLSRDMIEKATSLYESLADRGTEPNLRTLNLFATLCVKNSQIDLGLKYLEMGLDKAKTRNSKWFPTDETIKLFLDYFEENHDSDRAEKFIQRMKTLNRLDSNSLPMNTKAPDAENEQPIS
ncbi:hypothetical protein DH2020_024194 [Rehmannia glutinosa]|uniref:Pentatricopeptide repeat-containing protein n=1 Tax=Rehmannia glutinosa TaxID=99300 RepID=A0ABR0WAN1_REHGL